MSLAGPQHISVSSRGFELLDLISADRLTGYVMTTRAAELGWDGIMPLLMRTRLVAGIYLIAASTAGYAFDTGVPPAGSDLRWDIEAAAFALGRGGRGGDYTMSGDGGNGGPAVKLRYPIVIDNLGTLAGGAPGGGRGGHAALGHGGGGGGGRPLGAGGDGVAPGSGTTGAAPGVAATKAAPGAGGAGTSGGGSGGAGADLDTLPGTGTPGDLTAGFAGGSQGLCVDGIAYASWLNPGARYGAEI